MQKSLLQNCALIIAERAISNAHRVCLTKITFYDPTRFTVLSSNKCDVQKYNSI